jgi:hypothetical protein
VWDAPLNPDEIVPHALRWLPIFKAHVEDAPHAGLVLQRGRKLGDGLYDIDLFRDAIEEKALGDAADAGA